MSINELIKMKAIPVLTLLIFSINYLFGQTIDSLNIYDCYDLVIKNYPAVKLKEIDTRLTQLRLKNINTAWLPTADFNGQVMYQSDAISIDMNIPIPGFTAPKGVKDQYKATIDINQMFYDGGIVKAQKKLEDADYNSEIQNVDVRLYQLKERINQVYFLILINKAREHLTDAVLEDLNERLKTVASAVKNGAVLPTNEDILYAEVLKAEQQLIEIQQNINSSISILSELTETRISSNCKLIEPDFKINPDLSFNRPEQKSFELQKEKLNALSNLTERDRFPKLFGFGQLGYGRPGLNMLDDKFDNYYIVGARLKWNIYDWNATRRKIQIYDLQKESISNESETLIKNLKTQVYQHLGKIDELEKSIKKDFEIVRLREKVTKVFSSQLENGVITSSDYVRELNSETQAKMSLEIHKIQLIQAKANLIFTKGEF